MQQLYKWSFIVYRVIVIVLIAFYFWGDISVDITGANGDYDFPEIIFVSAGAVLVILSFLLLFKGISDNTKKITRYILTALIFITLLVEIYWLYDTFFVCGCFTGEDSVMAILTVLFTAITVISLIGFVKRRTQNKVTKP